MAESQSATVGICRKCSLNVLLGQKPDRNVSSAGVADNRARIWFLLRRSLLHGDEWPLSVDRSRSDQETGEWVYNRLKIRRIGGRWLLRLVRLLRGELCSSKVADES